MFKKLVIIVSAMLLLAAAGYVYYNWPAPAERDLEFARGSGIELSELTPDQQQNLAVLAKVWGFVKYHHPVAASGKINMDAELFRLIPRLVQQTATYRDQQLLSWLQQLGDYRNCPQCREADADTVLRHPEYYWHLWQLSPALQQKLDAIALSKPPRRNYWVKKTMFVGNPQFHELDYPDLQHIDSGYRLLALFRYWNIIQYYFPYRDLMDNDWEQVLIKSIPDFVNADSDEDYYRALARLTHAISDTHGYLSAPAAIFDNVYGGYRLPFEVRFIQDQAVVYYTQPQLAPANGPQPGDVLLSVAGRSITELVAEYLPLLSASNTSAALRNIAPLLTLTQQSQVEISWLTGSEQKTATIEAFPSNTLRQPWDYLINASDQAYYRVQPDIGYIHLGKLTKKGISGMMQQLHDSKAIIIDARTYPAEFVVHDLAKYLFMEKTPFARFSTMQPHLPGSFQFTKPLQTKKASASDYYQGKVVLLVNEVSLSQAEFTVMALQANGRATVIGSTTAGADGDISMIPLPGGMRTWITGIGVFYPDGGQTQRIGIVPDIPVEPTIEGIRQGRDEVLEYALSWLQQQ